MGRHVTWARVEGVSKFPWNMTPDRRQDRPLAVRPHHRGARHGWRRRRRRRRARGAADGRADWRVVRRRESGRVDGCRTRRRRVRRRLRALLCRRAPRAACRLRVRWRAHDDVRDRQVLDGRAAARGDRAPAASSTRRGATERAQPPASRGERRPQAWPGRSSRGRRRPHPPSSSSFSSGVRDGERGGGDR